MAVLSGTRSGGGEILSLAKTDSGDLGSQQLDINFKLQDSNANFTPQARISGKVGKYGADAGTTTLEGCGHLLFSTSDAIDTTSSNFDVRMVIGHNGNVGIGTNIHTSDPGYRLKVDGTFYSSGSSRDYKENIEDYTPNTSNLANLRPVTYDYKTDHENKGYNLGSEKQIGLIAEEVADVYPELAIKNFEWNPDAIDPETNEATGQNEWRVRNVDYQKLTIILLAEVQKLRAEIEELKA
jgi:hypothetical protein